jgi:hypothetical protein
MLAGDGTAARGDYRPAAGRRWCVELKALLASRAVAAPGKRTGTLTTIVGTFTASGLAVDAFALGTAARTLDRDERVAV